MGDTVLAWSGGKDAAFALYRLRESGEDLAGLWTTVNDQTGRSSMHGVRRELFRDQAAAVGLPIRLASIDGEVDNASYEAFVHEEYARYADCGVQTVVYADLHLEDIRAYRESILEASPLDGRWPLWGMDTEEVVRGFIEAGFEATVVAVDTGALGPAFLGRPVDEGLLAALPDGVDPAGEGGEYHTFVTDGPVFDRPVRVEHGRTVKREVGDTTMAYLDLEPAHTDR